MAGKGDEQRMSCLNLWANRAGGGFKILKILEGEKKILETAIRGSRVLFLLSPQTRSAPRHNHPDASLIGFRTSLRITVL